MNHADHVSLLKGTPGLREQLGQPVEGQAGVWADLGAGEGAFTLALADLLGADAVIYALDRDVRALQRQGEVQRARFPQAQVRYRSADFTHPLDLPPLDGLLMANALHFVARRRQPELIQRLRTALRPGGQFLLVEYNVDRGNVWVPHPLSYPSWQDLAAACGFHATYQLNRRPSHFLGEIYSAISF